MGPTLTEQVALWDLPPVTTREPVPPRDAPPDDVAYTAWGVYVICRDETHQAHILDRLRGDGLHVRPV